jgi:hypothetical protein
MDKLPDVPGNLSTSGFRHTTAAFYASTRRWIWLLSMALGGTHHGCGYPRGRECKGDRANEFLHRIASTSLVMGLVDAFWGLVMHLISAMGRIQD